MKTTFNNAAVRGPLNVYGKVNSKNLNNIVLLNSSAVIESAVSFHSLQGESLNTEDNISGTNFNLWYENVLWNRGKDEQVIGGNWKVKRVKMMDDATGNGLINGKSVKEIEKNLRSSIGAIDAAINNHNGQYLELCRDLGGKANDSKNSIHVLKHFELDLKLQETSEIFSYFGFESSANENFILINTNCTSQLYKWQKEHERFKLLGKVSTGVVYDWALVRSDKSEDFIITNSRMEANYPCMYGGLNVWKIIGDQIFHVTSISNDTDVHELHVNNYQPGRFFTLNNLDMVMHYDVFGQPKEKWQLPMEHYNYSFVPPEFGSDVTLYNGKKLFMLESKYKSRQTRHFWPDNNSNLHSKAPIMSMTTSQKPGESPVTTFKQPAPIQKDNVSLPSIPSKPFMRNDDNADFVSRIRNVGNALRKSMSDSFGKVNKLTIKNVDSNAEVDKKVDVELRESEKTSKSPHETSSTEEEAQLPVTKNLEASFIVISSKPNATENVSGTFMQKLKSVGKAIGKTASFSGTLDPKHLKSQNVAMEGAEIGSSESPETSSSSEPSRDISKASDDSTKHEDFSKTTTDSSVEPDEVSTESSIPSSTEISLLPDSLKTSTKPPLQTENQHKPSPIHVTPQIILPSEDDGFSDNLEYPAETTKFPEVHNEALDLEQSVPHEILTGSGVRETENFYFPERGSGEFVMMYVGPRYQKRALYAVTRSRDSIVKGNHNIIEVISSFNYFKCQPQRYF